MRNMKKRSMKSQRTLKKRLRNEKRQYNNSIDQRYQWQ